MKKSVTEQKTFCDFCDQPGWAQCLICDKDLCRNHRLELSIYLDRQDHSFRASLCPVHARPLLDLLLPYPDGKERGIHEIWQMDEKP